MIGLENALHFETFLRTGIITVIPIVLLVAIILYLKNRMENDLKSKPIDIEAIREEMNRIAKEKLAERENQPLETQQKVVLTKEEIQKKLESERETYNEFELIDPLKEFDVIDEDQESEK